MSALTSKPTGLRSMFRELINPLLSDGSTRTLDGTAIENQQAAAERLSLMAELLTLNFHEHFELGPLLRYVDQLPNQSPENRQCLRSAARRIVSREAIGSPLEFQPFASGRSRQSTTQ